MMTKLADDPFVSEVEVTGHYPVLQRVKTNLTSLDIATSHKGNLGIPLRVLIEAYGYTNTGKSTLAYFLAGKVAQQVEDSSIHIADLEMGDSKDYIPMATGVSGFKGKVHMMDVVDQKTEKLLFHEQILTQLARDLLFREDVPAVIWDSIGATQAMAHMSALLNPKETLGEAKMGKHAFLVSAVADALRTGLISKKTPSTAIAINHVHQVIGGRGHITPGGERKGFLAGLRLMLWTDEVFRVDEEDKGSPILGFLVRGQVEKLRFGGRGRTFSFYIVPGYGVHEGVSAMFDAFEMTYRMKKSPLDYLKAERGARIKLNGKSLGYLKKDLLSYALEGKRRKFYGFQEAMSRFVEDVENGRVEVKESSEGGSDGQDLEEN
jgi:RecA/RadA recombinase